MYSWACFDPTQITTKTLAKGNSPCPQGEHCTEGKCRLRVWWRENHGRLHTVSRQTACKRQEERDLECDILKEINLPSTSMTRVMRADKSS